MSSGSGELVVGTRRGVAGMTRSRRHVSFIFEAIVIALWTGAFCVDAFVLHPPQLTTSLQQVRIFGGHVRTTRWHPMTTGRDEESENDDQSIEEDEGDNKQVEYYDDFGDFVIGETSSSNNSERSSDVNYRIEGGILQTRIREIIREQDRREAQADRNWKRGNWRVRGFSLDPQQPSALQEADTIEMDASNNDESNEKKKKKPVHVSHVVPDRSSSLSEGAQHRILVGRTDGSVCLVRLGTEYLTKFTAQLKAKPKEEEDGSTKIQVTGELAREEEEESGTVPFEIVTQFKAHEESKITSLLSVEDSDRVFTAAEGSGVIQQWLIPSQQEENVTPLKRLDHAHQDTVIALKTVSIDDQEPSLLFSASVDGALALWDLETADLVYTCNLKDPEDEDVNVVVQCADVDTHQGTLYVGLASGHVMAYSVRELLESASVGGEAPMPVARFMAHDGGITALHCAGEGTLARGRPETESTVLLTGGADGVVKQWELLSRQLRPNDDTVSSPPRTVLEHWPRLATQRLPKKAHLFKGHDSAPVVALASLGATKFVSAGTDGTVRAWSPSHGKELFCMNGFTSELSSLCLHNYNGMLITDGMEQYVCVHDFEIDENDHIQGNNIDVDKE